MFLKSNGISDLISVIPSVQHFFPWIVIHHGVGAILVGELYVRVPQSSSLRVVSEVDCGESVVTVVNGVDHSTSNKSISHGSYRFYEIQEKVYQCNFAILYRIKNSLTIVHSGA